MTATGIRAVTVGIGCFYLTMAGVNVGLAIADRDIFRPLCR